MIARMASAAHLKVLQLASGDLWAGAEVQLYCLTKALAARGDIDVRVALLNDGILAERLRAQHIPVAIFDETKRHALAIGRELRALLRDFRPHVIHSHRQKENVLAWLAGMGLGARGVRTVHGASEHRPPLWRLDKHLYRRLDALSARHGQDAIVAVSAELAALCRHEGAADKLVVIENGIDIAELERRAQAPVALPASDKVKIGIVCRMVPVKRVDLFIEAAKMVCAARDDAQFLIFGDGPLLGAHRALADELKLGARVHFAGFRADMPACLRALDLLLITSDHEGLPLNLLEAMALGVPVAAHAVGGIPQALDSGDVGELVHEQTARAYADAILKVLREREAVRARARLAQDRVRARYSATRMADDYVALYRKLAS